MNYEQLIRDLEEFENDIDINETGIYTKILDIIRHLKSENTELIASGEKTIEVRKTRPKIEAPFKCYIYA